MNFEHEVWSYYKYLKNFGFSLSENREMAEDLAQETIVIALTNQHQFEAGTNLKAWLRVILKNLNSHNLRRAKRWVSDPEGIHEASLSVGPDQETAVEHQELYEAIDQLPASDRDMLLAHMHGYTYEDLAPRFGLTMSAVGSKIHRAKIKLRSILLSSTAQDLQPLQSAKTAKPPAVRLELIKSHTITYPNLSQKTVQIFKVIQN